MQRIPTLLAVVALAVGLAASGTGLAQGTGTAGTTGGPRSASGSPAFADVPPCHWAASAVAKVAKAGIFVGFPPDPAYLSVNALRQVFEGLRCADPAWSLRFLSGAPRAFASTPGPALAAFTLDPTITSLSASSARISLQLTAVVAEAGGQRRLERTGSVTATHGTAGWRVPYAELASLDLPFFPR
ncbi:MAG: S-layer homology domain-containing protein [Deinococcales bacterium]